MQLPGDMKNRGFTPKRGVDGSMQTDLRCIKHLLLPRFAMDTAEKGLTHANWWQVGSQLSNVWVVILCLLHFSNILLRRTYYLELFDVYGLENGLLHGLSCQNSKSPLNFSGICNLLVFQLSAGSDVDGFSCNLLVVLVHHSEMRNVLVCHSERRNVSSWMVIRLAVNINYASFMITVFYRKYSKRI